MPKSSKLPLSGLTAKQRRILNFIAAYVSSEDQGPTLEEIRDHLGVSAVSTVHEHIGRLAEKGFLSREWYQSRTIALTPEAYEARFARMIPMKARIVRGRLVEATGDTEEVPVPAKLAGSAGSWALTVGDDSLIDEGFQKGDTLVVGVIKRVRHGALIIGVQSRGVVIRRARKQGRGVELTARSEARSAPLKASDVNILGELVALLRRYR